jgi:hypothetical protein
MGPHHLDDPLARLREAHRVLKSAGLLVVRVPNFPVQYGMRRLRSALGRLTGGKLLGFAAARALFRVSGKRWVCGPSLVAYGARGSPA